GEAEIFGQVKDAYAAARDRGAAGKAINRIFQKSFQAAKFIRNATNIGAGQINVANVAVDLSSKIFGSLDEASVLSIGTGDIGEAEIFGQVKDAYAAARDRGAAGKAINRIFQKSFQAAKFIRNATNIGAGQINVANVAVDLSSKIFGSLDEASVLSIGTGDIG